jgi:hypothetical protein
MPHFFEKTAASRTNNGFKMRRIPIFPQQSSAFNLSTWVIIHEVLITQRLSLLKTKKCALSPEKACPKKRGNLSYAAK